MLPVKRRVSVSDDRQRSVTVVFILTDQTHTGPLRLLRTRCCFSRNTSSFKKLTESRVTDLMQAGKEPSDLNLCWIQRRMLVY